MYSSIHLTARRMRICNWIAVQRQEPAGLIYSLVFGMLLLAVAILMWSSMLEQIRSFIEANNRAVVAFWGISLFIAFTWSAALATAEAIGLTCGGWAASLPLRWRHSLIGIIAVAIERVIPIGLIFVLLSVPLWARIHSSAVDSVAIVWSVCLLGGMICGFFLRLLKIRIWSWRADIRPYKEGRAEFAWAAMGRGSIHAKKRQVGWVLSMVESFGVAWIGLWQARLPASRKAIFALTPFVIFGGGVAWALVRSSESAIPLLACGVIFGHGLFASMFRSDPGRSPAVRTSSVAFFSLFASMIRLPLVSSLALMTFFSLLAIASSNLTAWAAIIASFGVLVTLNLLFAVSVAGSLSRWGGHLFYASVITLLITAVQSIGMFGLLLALIIFNYLARRARRVHLHVLLD